MALLRSPGPLLALAIAGCYPAIDANTYSCAIDGTCPPGQTCDEFSDLCVAPETNSHFACNPTVLHEPDDTLADAFDAGTAVCDSILTSPGCVGSGDTANWLQFTTQSNCEASSLSFQLTFAMDREPLTLVATDASGSTIGNGAACASTGPDDVTVCAMTFASSNTGYFVEVLAGDPTCNDTCNGNAYTVSITYGASQ